MLIQSRDQDGEKNNFSKVLFTYIPQQYALVMGIKKTKNSLRRLQLNILP